MNTKYLVIASMLVIAGIGNSIFATITLKNRTGETIKTYVTDTTGTYVVNNEGKVYPVPHKRENDRSYVDFLHLVHSNLEDQTEANYNVTFDILISASGPGGWGRQISVDGVRTPDWSGLLKNGSTYVITKQNAAPDIYVFTSQK